MTFFSGIPKKIDRQKSLTIISLVTNRLEMTNIILEITNRYYDVMETVDDRFERFRDYLKEEISISSMTKCRFFADEEKTDWLDLTVKIVTAEEYTPMEILSVVKEILTSIIPARERPGVIKFQQLVFLVEGEDVRHETNTYRYLELERTPNCTSKC